MNELSLFTGAGGGVLASKLLGWRTIGYVEFNDYCQQVLAKRIQEGYLDEAPIFTDVRAFASIAENYRGFADVVTGGFPCQPHSRAGKRGGESDDRDMWPATIDIIGKVRPSIVLLENNPGILDFGYGARVSGDLAEIGYVGHQIVLGASRLGAHHGRERVWWLAADSNLPSNRLLRGYGQAEKKHRETETRPIPALVENITWPDVSNPRAYGSHDGLANRLERTKAIGNGQVPAVAAAAFRFLSGI